ncbi:MAG: N-acetylmuramoyl-L-alanine amidase [Saprospiraceae bacterium]
MRRLGILLLLVGILFNFKPVDEAGYFKVRANAGDGAYSILRKYGLLNDCNLEHFYNINHLDPDNFLLVGSEYLLPVYIYRYDGVSIESTLEIQDSEKAQRIHSYNDFLRNQGLRRMTIESSHILWVPFHELYCMAEKVTRKAELVNRAPESTPATASSGPRAVAASSKSITMPVFGREYAEVPVKSDVLKRKVFFIVAGHGGPDIGCNTLKEGHRLCEDEYAYDVALRLARLLMENGANVEIIIEDPNDGIRDTELLEKDYDERCLGEKLPRNQKLRLQQRSDAVNKLYREYRAKGYTDQKMISIHVDSQNENNRQDVYFFHAPGSKAGSHLAFNMYKTFQQKYDYYQKGRGYRGSVREKEYFVLVNTLPPAVLVELANMQNEKDHRRILSPTNRQYLAQWLYEGIIKD